MNSFLNKGVLGTGALVVAFGAATLPAFAVSVSVNGQTVTLNPPPIERAGRIFVPLRGVFQELGASVVYQGGVINATGKNGATISLKIGSTQASVNGNVAPLDVAPFVVGASTYVPLRFVSQALGAGVNYDGANQIVALTTAGSVGVAPAAPVAAVPIAQLTNILRAEEPARGSIVASVKPTLQASFVQPVDANSVRIALDGLDITAGATRSTTGFIYAPPSPLQSLKHTIVVSGKLSTGQPFTQTYAFTSGTELPHNSLTITSPEDGITLSPTFTVSGHTAPNARVHVVAGATTNVGGFYAFATGSYSGDTIADERGNFSQDVSLQTVGGSIIGLTVTSTDPTTKESAEKKLQLKAK